MAVRNDRATAISIQLVQAHELLREQLAMVRAQFDGSRMTGVQRDLLTHCVGFCRALTSHHTGEDARLFPALRDAHPDLGPVIDNLIEDHQLIATILQRVHDLVAKAANADPRRIEAIGREFDGLAAIMESHFSYEERRISQVLDQFEADDWVSEVFHVEPL